MNENQQCGNTGILRLGRCASSLRMTGTGGWLQEMQSAMRNQGDGDVEGRDGASGCILLLGVLWVLLIPR